MRVDDDAMMMDRVLPLLREIQELLGCDRGQMAVIVKSESGQHTQITPCEDGGILSYSVAIAAGTHLSACAGGLSVIVQEGPS